MRHPGKAADQATTRQNAYLGSQDVVKLTFAGIPQLYADQTNARLQFLELIRRELGLPRLQKPLLRASELAPMSIRYRIHNYPVL